MKPMLDKMIDRVVASLSGDARRFYDREFSFFNEVTDISGKLKPFIKKSKPEKKVRMSPKAWLSLDVANTPVYTSRPKSTRRWPRSRSTQAFTCRRTQTASSSTSTRSRAGLCRVMPRSASTLMRRPLFPCISLDPPSVRSSSQAPFMATFKVRKERVELAPAAEDTVVDDPEKREQSKTHYEVWQAAIFKVGDDCRQDVLALQIIAMFKNIFTDIGLTLYLFPYRVTATAPGVRTAPSALALAPVGPTADQRNPLAP
jgi:phosphatidylinositol 4-kinase